MPARSRNASRFRDIRVWDGSQDRAFEELCFQLRDPTPDGVELIKTGPPDAGVEWYWRHPDGSEEGWQVKFIFQTDGLLKAMRASLKSAVEKRPGLRRLTFCIAWDLADDPSRAGGTQARERFEAAKTRWRTKWPTVEIRLVSAGELLERLAREEHRGREWFFFGERILGSDWCADELEAAIDDAGDRYTPEQNVDLPIDRILEALALSADFEAQLGGRRDAILTTARELIKKSYAPTRWADLLAQVQRPLAELEQIRLVAKQPPLVRVPLALELLGHASDAIDTLLEALRPVARPDKRDREDRSDLSEAERVLLAQQEREATSAQALWARAQKVQEAIYDSQAPLAGSIGQAADRRAVFVEGVAGTGKTHLFCDVGQRLGQEGHPVLVILGQRFLDDSPWTTLARLLGEPNLSPDEIATALAASGEASGRRAVVFIDALNEARDPTMWSTELADIRRRLTRSEWVGLAVSCRSTYLDLVEPATGRDEAFVSVEHIGYRGREFEATSKIFVAHGVQQPRIPLLLPEFNNPLFLKLYCQGIRDGQIPTAGSEHLSGIFERFVAGRKARVERTLQLDRRLDIVGQAIRAFAEQLAEQGHDRVSYEEAYSLINDFAPHLRESPRTLLEAMASEGLLSIERGWLRQRTELAEVVSFPYQRFSDHLVLSAFLDKYVPTEAPEDVLAALGPSGSLGAWLLDAPQGLIEALTIQLPERWGIELLDVLPAPAADDHHAHWRLDRAWSAFISSTVLRARSSFGERSRELINEGLGYKPREMADALISVAPDPEHPYNGAALHAYLSGIPMSHRDAYWTEQQYYSLGDPSRALDRLIRWAARGPYPDYPAEVITLACVPLVWQLASPNRFARDYTTKALASVLVDRPDVCLDLVETFRTVDDPYVIQRIAAAILGAVTRGRRPLERAEARNLMSALVASLVEHDARLPDVLTRDYIASLARWLRRRGLISAKLAATASPPYASKPPKMPRTSAYLEATYPRSERRDEGYGVLMYSALWTHSDWYSYVVSGCVNDFLPDRLGQPMPPPTAHAANPLTTDAPTTDMSYLLDSLDEPQRVRVRRAAGIARPKPPRRRMAFPPERAARFIFQRCIELGWSPELFGSFDSSISSRMRDSHKPERFGKKYQWIALFELAARLADNFALRHWGAVEPYEGAWQLPLRDLDPTLPPERIEVGSDEEYVRAPTFPVDRRPTWWSPDKPTFDELIRGEEGSWAELTADLPTPERLLRVADATGMRWLAVDGYYNWRDDPTDAPSVLSDDGPSRDLAILVCGTVVKQASLPKLREWLGSHPDLLRSLPDWDSQGIYRAFWSELPGELKSYGHPPAWRRPDAWGKLPVSSAAVQVGYSGEAGGFDCSLTTSVTADLPSSVLARLASLRWSETHAAWIDDASGVWAQYHETDEGFHRDHALLMNEEALRRLLREHDLALAIGMYCERRVLDSRRFSPDVLGWVDYVGHVLIHGEQWEAVALRPLEQHHASRVHGEAVA